MEFLCKIITRVMWPLEWVKRTHATYWVETLNIISSFINDFLKLLSLKNYLIEITKAWNFTYKAIQKDYVYYTQNTKKRKKRLKLSCFFMLWSPFFFYFLLKLVQRIPKVCQFLHHHHFFLIYVLHNILWHVSNTLFFLFDNAATIPCNFDNDCPEVSYPLILMCIDDFCEYLLA